MKQVFHIFAKDVRRFYPEILISLMTLAAMVRIYPQVWGVQRIVAPGIPWLPGATMGLVGLGWLLLIARVVHDEALVGDRQFWITRPYRWYLLLAAKAMFVVLFVVVPFFGSQMAMLKIGGFYPTAYLPGMVWNLAFIAMVFVLPLMAMAAMTSNFGKMLLGILILVAYVAGFAYVSSLLPISSSDETYIATFVGASILTAVIAVVVLCYAQRRTTLARVLTVGVGLTVSLLGLFGPEDSAMRLSYPEHAEKTGVSVEVAFGEKLKQSAEPGMMIENLPEVQVIFPLTLSAIQASTAVNADYAKVVITTASGERWNSHWQGMSAIWEPQRPNSAVSVKIKRSFYERVKSQPVKVELTFAMTALGSGKAIRSEVKRVDFSIPGGGLCNQQEDWSRELTCRLPLRKPPLMRVTSQLSLGNCGVKEPRDEEGDFAEQWVGTLDASPADFGFTPVWTTSINLSAVDPRNQRSYLCAGAPLTFTPYTVAWRGQRTIKADGVKLEDLVYRMSM